MNTHRDGVVGVVEDAAQSLQVSVLLTQHQLQSTNFIVLLLQTVELLIDRALKHTTGPLQK